MRYMAMNRKHKPQRPMPEELKEILAIVRQNLTANVKAETERLKLRRKT
jgi:hypothetical protein